MRDFAREHLSPAWKRRVRRALATVLSPAATTPLRAMLTGGLEATLRAQWLRDWDYAAEPPHFTDHQIVLFALAFSREAADPRSFARAFFASEVVREGDKVLDVGCGDGFFSKRFFAARAGLVDAVDVEPAAIAFARRHHADDRVRYHLLDASRDAFPEPSYDVIVWDGAIGHFSSEDSQRLITRLGGILAPDGVFVGSESLGREGSDHLQFFEDIESLRALFLPYFPVVRVRSLRYGTPALMRHEGYWRCARSEERLSALLWQ